MTNKAINDLLKYNRIKLTFTRPTLSANGTLGGSSFAVASNAWIGSAYQIADGAISAGNAIRMYLTSSYVLFYNPKALNVTWLTWYGGYSDAQAYRCNIFASNDNSNWTTLKSELSFSGGTAMDLTSNTGYYKYYKIVPTGGNNGSVDCSEITFTATYYL